MGKGFVLAFVWVALAVGLGFQFACMAALKRQVAVQSLEVARLQGRVDREDAAVAAQTTSVSKQQGELDGLEGEMQRVHSEVGEVRKEVDAQQSKEEALEARVAGKLRQVEAMMGYRGFGG